MKVFIALTILVIFVAAACVGGIMLYIKTKKHKDWENYR